jgi:hypothetical protein
MTKTDTEQQPEPRKRKVQYVTALEIEAAKLRIDTDRQLGRQTPEWVFRLADAKPESESA